jgi:hypothetical protein
MPLRWPFTDRLSPPEKEGASRDIVLIEQRQTELERRVALIEARVAVIQNDQKRRAE